MKGKNSVSKKSGRLNRRNRQCKPNLAIVNNSAEYSPERMAMNIYTLRQSAIAKMTLKAHLTGIKITDKLGPKGAGEYIRDSILSGAIPPTWCPPDDPADIAWLEQIDWWEQILSAAERIGIVIP